MGLSRITSRHNPRVKSAAQLRSARGRRRQGRIIIDGARETLRAFEAGAPILEAFVCEELCDSADSRISVETLKSQETELLSVSLSVYAVLAFGERADGIVSVAETPRRGLNDLSIPAKPLIAILERLEKPGNVGAILRSADAAGINAVIVANGGTDLFNPNTIRASLGTVFRDNVCEASSAETRQWLRQRGITMVAARPDAKRCYTDVDLRGSVAIVLGSEAAGLGDEWRGPDVVEMRLPMQGLADSLNVSTTAAVLFYEALRQRS
jgi:TrmH family RNA methyltransferase